MPQLSERDLALLRECRSVASECRLRGMASCHEIAELAVSCDDMLLPFCAPHAAIAAEAFETCTLPLTLAAQQQEGVVFLWPSPLRPRRATS